MKYSRRSLSVEKEFLLCLKLLAMRSANERWPNRMSLFKQWEAIQIRFSRLDLKCFPINLLCFRRS